MKQIKNIALALLLALTAQTVGAQIHESKSYIKKTTITKEEKVDTNPWKKCQWFGRAGVLIPVGASEHDELMSPMAGFDLDLGFKLRMGKHGWYWGMDLAMFTGGLKGKECDVLKYQYSNSRETRTIDGESSAKIGGRLGLTTFGWRARFTDLILDVNAGLAIGFTSQTKFDNYEALQDFSDEPAKIEFPVGIGLAYKHFSLDFTFLYTPMFEYSYDFNYYDKFGNRHYGWTDLRYNKFRISIGYLF